MPAALHPSGVGCQMVTPENWKYLPNRSEAAAGGAMPDGIAPSLHDMTIGLKPPGSLNSGSESGDIVGSLASKRRRSPALRASVRLPPG